MSFLFRKSENSADVKGKSREREDDADSVEFEDAIGNDPEVEETPINDAMAALSIEELESESKAFADFMDKYKSKRSPRRTLLPIRDIKVSPSFWSVMKNSIGKDLSRIAMPIDFNEPLSLLQRLTEDLEYSELLDNAANASTSQERLAFVAAFSMTAYGTTEGRTGKPFNPLLGETFELVREDKGWRYVSEQVSHHPPISACHCESKDWVFWQEYRLGSRFRGQYLKVTPEGPCHLLLKKHNEHYSWRKPNTTIHNIILGKLWIDHEGDVNVLNHKNGDKAVLSIRSWNSVGKAFTEIHGFVSDSSGKKYYAIDGTWDGFMNATPLEGSPPGSKPFTLWKLVPRPADAKSYFGFTTFACQLNEPEPNVCPTDSRLRPDQRCMENGELSQGTHEKLRIEEKQRSIRRHRETSNTHWRPRWFTRQVEPDTNQKLWAYAGGYWSAKEVEKFTDVPSLF